MTKEDLRDKFREKTGENIFKLVNTEVVTNSSYIVWLENKVLKTTVCDYCDGTGFDSYPNHSTTHGVCPKCQP